MDQEAHFQPIPVTTNVHFVRKAAKIFFANEFTATSAATSAVDKISSPPNELIHLRSKLQKYYNVSLYQGNENICGFAALLNACLYFNVEPDVILNDFKLDWKKFENMKEEEILESIKKYFTGEDEKPFLLSKNC